MRDIAGGGGKRWGLVELNRTAHPVNHGVDVDQPELLRAWPYFD
jgi:hypothetical protein